MLNNQRVPFVNFPLDSPGRPTAQLPSATKAMNLYVHQAKINGLDGKNNLRRKTHGVFTMFLPWNLGCSMVFLFLMVPIRTNPGRKCGSSWWFGKFWTWLMPSGPSGQIKAEDRLKVGIPSADFHPSQNWGALAQTVANSPYLIDSAGFLNSSFVGNTWCPDAHGVARIAVSLWVFVGPCKKQAFFIHWWIIMLMQRIDIEVDIWYYCWLDPIKLKLNSTGSEPKSDGLSSQWMGFV